MLDYPLDALTWGLTLHISESGREVASGGVWPQNSITRCPKVRVFYFRANVLVYEWVQHQNKGYSKTISYVVEEVITCIGTNTDAPFHLDRKDGDYRDCD